LYKSSNTGLSTRKWMEDRSITIKSLNIYHSYMMVRIKDLT